MITPATRLVPACLLLCAVVLFNAGPARAGDFPASALPQYYPVDKNAVFVTQRFHRAHQGIDLAPIIKDAHIDVHATGDGKVILAEDCTQGWCKGYGNVVVIQHTNWSNRKTLYAHLERIDVKKDDAVKQGQVIGILGNTGSTTGAILHLEICNKSCSNKNFLSKLNPLTYFKDFKKTKFQK